VTTLVRPGPAVIDRAEFIAQRFDYRAGQHVTIMAPTDCGKTTLLYQLLQRVARPSLPAVVLVMKPKDETVTALAKTLEARRAYSWPPVMRRGPMGWWSAKPRAYTVWPRHTFDPDVDDANMHGVFRAAIRDSYRRGDRILVADEVAGLAVDLGLGRDLGAVWTRGRSMKCGLWSASQRPAFVPLHAYSQAEHLFLHHDPDLRSRKRYSEIGGVDPKMILAVTADLPKHHYLYLGRTGQRYCVITP
jgi:hypothetical protein